MNIARLILMWSEVIAMRRNSLPLKEMLADFADSSSGILIYYYATVHYRSMNSGQTSFRTAIKRYGYRMKATTAKGHIIIRKLH